MSTAPMIYNKNTLETDVPMYFESFRVGIVTLRVSQAKKIPNSSSNPKYVNTNKKIRRFVSASALVQCLDDNDLVFSVSLAL